MLVFSQPPPPPGGSETGYFDPAVKPPPPPSIKSHAWTIWKRSTAVPLTEAVCSGDAGEGALHRQVCSKVLDELGKFQFIYGVGTVAPLCDKVCFHSCDGVHIGGEDDDSFRKCPRPECAESNCYDFLLRECDPIQHAAINTMYQRLCTVAPPSPPAPPAPPPSPPAPPHSPSPRAPPPIVQYAERFRDDELPTDPDCGLVEYAECAELVRQFAQRNPGYSDKLRVTTSHCEDTETETDCFVGCGYGDRHGGTYRFLLPGIDDRFTKHRCKLSLHPRCACSLKSSTAPPPALHAPPPPTQFTEGWSVVQVPLVGADGKTRDTSRGAMGAMTQRLVNGRTVDLSLRAGPMHQFQCPGEDDGRETCALTCSNEHLSRLRAFTVTGEAFVASPPPAVPPPYPVGPPPPFTASSGDVFNACQDSCTDVDEDETLCRDGGYGSFSPALCPYATQVRSNPRILPSLNPFALDNFFPFVWAVLEVRRALRGPLRPRAARWRRLVRVCQRRDL